MGAGGAGGELLEPKTCFFSETSKHRGSAPDRGFAKNREKYSVLEDHIKKYVFVFGNK